MQHVFINLECQSYFVHLDDIQVV